MVNGGFTNRAIGVTTPAKSGCPTTPREWRPVLRERLQSSLRAALDRDDQRGVATLRLILAALKERDHAARAAGRPEGVPDEEIETMLGAMVQQREEEIGRCEEHAQLDRAEQEAEEIAVIRRLLPPQLEERELEAAVEAVIADTGAHKQKDTGRVMSALKSRYPGRMDLAKAKRLVRAQLTG
jgi:uncharacterized protein